MRVIRLVPENLRLQIRRALIVGWVTIAVVLFVVVVGVSFAHKSIDLSVADWGLGTIVLVGATLSFCAEYVDSTLGMGYGTTLSPLLMLLGFTPAQVVPAVLGQQLICGVVASMSHHAVGNVDFGRGRRAIKLALLLGGSALVGSYVAARVSLSLEAMTVKLVTGLIVIAMGVVAIVSGRVRLKFSWWRAGVLGLVAAANKGFMGGGYGPLVTAGQLVVGTGVREAVAVTSLAEALCCVGGLTGYLTSGVGMFWPLAGGLLLGGVVAAGLSAVTVRAVKPESLRGAVAACCFALGLLTLLRVVLGQ